MALSYVACSGPQTPLVSKPHRLGCRQSLTKKTCAKSQVLSKGWVSTQKWPRLFSLVRQPVHFRVYNCQLLGEQDQSSTSLPAVVMVYHHRKCPLYLRLLSSVPQVHLFTLSPLKELASPWGLFPSL